MPIVLLVVILFLLLGVRPGRPYGWPAPWVIVVLVGVLLVWLVAG